MKGGCEAAVHAVRRYLEGMPDDYAVVKLDFKNAFNCVNRTIRLSEVYCSPRYISVLPSVLL